MMRAAAAAVLLCLFASSCLSASATTSSEEVSERIPFEPIRIFSNAEFTAENGVTSGSGTSDDPYVIEGLEIDGNGSATCVHLADTTSHVVIRNVMAKNGSFGVKLQEVENVRVDGCIIQDQTVGVRVSYSDKSAIVGNTVSQCDYGVYLVYSEGVRVEDNTYVDNETDFFEEKLPWELGRIGTYVCIALAIPLSIILGLLLWMRLGPPRKGVVRPPVE